MSRLLALGVIAALVGCVSSGAVSAGRDVTMAVGQRIALPDAATLRYAGIANDSRCPPDVQCIRAGDADVLFDYTPRGGAPARVTLNTERARTSTVGAWRLQLVDLAQGAMPQATVRIDAATGATTP
ncbi:hypothetical protein ACFPOA_00370 [Lysobacter niabensis]|uniref:hypothetical protein n=1 Tax=Agrilutibacter niabensis TaxID=380628 RepID=UPI003606A577